MASSSGNSSGSTQINQPSGSSEEDLQVVLMDQQRKRKRMESNRESARRSRMRKQKHLDELMAQMDQLRIQNGQIINNIKVTTQHCVGVEFENSVLSAQVVELTQRLESLNEILSCVNAISNNHESFVSSDPWNLMMGFNFNQTIMADDVFLY